MIKLWATKAAIVGAKFKRLPGKPFYSKVLKPLHSMAREYVNLLSVSYRFQVPYAGLFKVNFHFVKLTTVVLQFF